MTDKIPEALAVLDHVISCLPPHKNGLIKARAAFAELISASEELRGVSLVFLQSRAIKIAKANARFDAALAAVENLP